MRKQIFLIYLLATLFYSCGQEKSNDENHVQVRQIKDVQTLNPMTYGGLKESRVMFELMYQPLLTIDLEKNEIKPLLAEAMPEVTVEDSISLFTYTIRKEAQWPNGEAVTAEDVLFSLKVANCPLVNNENVRIKTAFIQDVYIDSSSNQTFVFQCDGYGPDMSLMTGDIIILPEYSYDPDGLLHARGLKELKNNYEALRNDPQIQEFASQFNAIAASRDPEAYVGSGGYELATWKTDQFITFKKVEDWWGDDLDLPFLTAHPEKITFHIIPDDATAVMALKNNQLDVMRDIPVNEFNSLSKNARFLSDYNVFSPNTYTVNYIGINSRLPQFKSKKTRQAMAHLLDVEGIIKNIGQSNESRSNSLISPYDEVNFNNEIEAYSFDPKRAKDMLKEDGWNFENGGWYKTIAGKKEQLSGGIQYKAGKHDYENIALIFQQAAEEIGIPIAVNPVENSVLSANLKQHNFEFYIRALMGNPFAFNFTPILHRKSAVMNGMNYTAFGTAESDSLINAIISTNDKSQQAEQIKAFQEILHDEANLLFLYFDEQKIAIHKRFENLKISGLYPNYEVSAFKLKE